VHRGDLGHVTALPVARLIDGLRAALALGVPGTSLRVRLLPALDIPGTMSKPKGTPRKYQNGPSSCAGTRSGEGWGFLGLLSGREWGLSLPGFAPVAQRVGEGGLARRRGGDCGAATVLQGRSTANGASTGAGGAELANYLPHQAGRTTERSGVVLALETKFLRFWTGQERDGVLSLPRRGCRGLRHWDGSGDTCTQRETGTGAQAGPGASCGPRRRERCLGDSGGGNEPSRRMGRLGFRSQSSGPKKPKQSRRSQRSGIM
jgi:hypothetical protein